MDFDNWFVDCVRDEQHEESFIIGSVSLAEGQLKRATGPLTEPELRSELDAMGVSQMTDDLIPRAREHADQKDVESESKR